MSGIVWLYVRSTINLAGLPTGAEAWIDADDAQFAPLLEARYLIPVDPPEWEVTPPS